MKKNLKKLYIAFILCILVSIYSYICAIDAIPENAILFEGEKLNLKTLYGITLNSDKVQLFNKFTVKEVSVSVIERTTVIPVGQVAGLKLYTSGVLVVGMSEIKGNDNQKYKPYENSGIEEGDMIIKVQEKEISDTNDLINTVNASNGEPVDIIYVRDGKTLECSIKPIQVSKKEYKLGLWVRDSAAGIGTMTFYEPSTGKFAALGHGISDIDTGDLINISNGEFITTKVLSIVKGEKGKPGKLQGTIDDSSNIGQIYKNTNIGVYGVINDLSAINLKGQKELEVALREEIELGKATIMCSLNGDKVKEYEIEIERLYINNNYDNKSMLIKVTDKELIEKTGGIIQGMSGCPIIQNGKFIGCVTNVLVNDPIQGYGVFGDLMVKEMKTIN